MYRTADCLVCPLCFSLDSRLEAWPCSERIQFTLDCFGSDSVRILKMQHCNIISNLWLPKSKLGLILDLTPTWRTCKQFTNFAMSCIGATCKHENLSIRLRHSRGWLHTKGCLASMVTFSNFLSTIYLLPD